MSAHERLADMIRTDRGDMNVYSEIEVRAALDAHRAEVLRAAADKLVAACPAHSTSAECWADCPCDYADELRRMADEAATEKASATAPTAELLPKADVVAWLIKKSREAKTWDAAVLASKVARGAVRPNNLRTLPANFFEPGRSYTSSTWKFRCEAITPSPTTGEPRALGWQLSPVNGIHLWHAVALDPDDWTHGGWSEVAEGGDAR
jgi:hypothetical protein